MKRVAVTYNLAGKLPPYENALRLVGLETVRNPESLEGLHGLLLTGGTDIDPALYGAARDPQTQEPDRERDALELALLKQALENNVPVLAICRGMQMFNVAHGGTLLQHLPSALHLVRPVDPATPAHIISVARRTRLGVAIGAGPHWVNSRHHQAAANIGDGLRVTASCATDGVVEALERPDLKFAVGVQWHPEDRVMSSAADRLLFRAFAAAMES